MFEQEAPFAIQIEMTEGCPLRCDFCGINAIRGKKREYKFMTIETAYRIAQAIERAEWNPRIEFAMHGEPTMNPERLRIIEAFRDTLGDDVYMMMLTNGVGLLADDGETLSNRIDYLFGFGMNTVALEEYSHCNAAEKIVEEYSGRYEWIHYPDEKNGNPHARHKGRKLVLIRDIAKNVKGTHAHLCNHCGCAGPLDMSYMDKRCAKPFREMSFIWDGSVTACCNDFKNRRLLGSINVEDDIEKLWNHPFFQAMRQRLYNWSRDFMPCYGCNFRTYRNGLLPDKTGVEYLPDINEEQKLMLRVGQYEN